MKKRTVIITGANSGIGKAAAMKFAAEGHCLIMACRNLGKSAETFNEIIRMTQNKDVHLMELDISLFESIRSFTGAFISQFDQLDILIHNAGFFNHGLKTYQLSKDGLELTFATNTFGPFLLTELLLPHLAKSEDARVLNAGTNNINHFFDPKRQIEFDNLKGEFREKRRYSSYKMYGDSKMGLLLLTYKMAEEYKELGIKVYNIMIPATKISNDRFKKMSSFYRFIGPLVQNLNPFSRTQEEMGDVYFEICTSPDFENLSGVMVDRRLNIIPPVLGKEKLNPLQVASQLLKTSKAPQYAGRNENLDRMWELGKEVISEYLK
ncbi:MAG: SDR family NAD(P)-dependent oxidoreductase [Balneolaceae bacterium]|jgi:NAD(P)-dependent dehydrogenase (short-subunit alcohol dehydrogenase family)|nr:SDR family NAD(P)-dependent oxidoreductase [Balneolaceae bacterium]